MISDLQDDLSELRALSEELMVDECRIEVGSDEWTLDPVSHRDVQATTVVYDGKCRVQRVNVQAAEVDAAAAFAGKTPTDLRLPLDAPEVPNGATVTITKHQRLSGRVSTVKGRSFQTFEKDARYACEGVDW